MPEQQLHLALKIDYLGLVDWVKSDATIILLISFPFISPAVNYF